MFQGKQLFTVHLDELKLRKGTGRKEEVAPSFQSHTFSCIIKHTFIRLEGGGGHSKELMMSSNVMYI